MPLLARSLPLDQAVDFSDGFSPVDGAGIHAALEKCVHVKFATAVGAVTQKLEDTFQPAHKLVEESVIMEVDLVDELVEVVFVASTQVDERLDCLVGVGGDLLSLACLDGLDCVIDKYSKVCDAVVDVGRLVDAD